jgi:hypothetical protein
MHETDINCGKVFKVNAAYLWEYFLVFRGYKVISKVKAFLIYFFNEEYLFWINFLLIV